MKPQRSVPGRAVALAAISFAVLALACGGGGGNRVAQPPPPPPPPPPATLPPAITTGSTLPATLEGHPYNVQLQASDGTAPLRWSLASGSLPPGISLSQSGVLSGTATNADSRSFEFRVQVQDSATPPRSDSRDFALLSVGRLRIHTSILPRIRVGAQVRLWLNASGGFGNRTWTVAAGSLPEGLVLEGTAAISGAATRAESQTFTLRLEDSFETFPQSAEAELTLEVLTSPARNDAIPKATRLGSGIYTDLSLSPFADPPGLFSPDTDYYQVSAPAGQVVAVWVLAQSPFGIAGSAADPVVEIVDAAGVRYQSCRLGVLLAYDNSPMPFTSECLNDDTLYVDCFVEGCFLFDTTDSGLEFRVPGAPGEMVTFYVRVLDWSGDARPELRYHLQLLGTNP